MAKPENVEPSKAKAQPNQKLPAGHFTPNGESTGKQTGAVRPTRDAYNERGRK